jgi:cytochrome c556
MSDKNNTPPPPEGELKFQMQAMTKMMERISFVMGNVCDKFEKVEKCGNEVGTSTQNMRKVGVESKSNNSSRTERPRWADYEDFEEDVDDFEDEAIGKVFDSLKTEETSGIELQANSVRGDISVTLGDMMM